MEYVEFTDAYRDQLYIMIKSLYAEDAGCETMSDEKIEKTLLFLTENQNAGNILLFMDENQVKGYSIVINFWSNEYGGIVLHIDELFVTSEFRNKKIGSDFISYLKTSRYNNCVALFLEVTPSNNKAYNLYRRSGFKDTGRNHLICHL